MFSKTKGQISQIKTFRNSHHVLKRLEEDISLNFTPILTFCTCFFHFLHFKFSVCPLTRKETIRYIRLHVGALSHKLHHMCIAIRPSSAVEAVKTNVSSKSIGVGNACTLEGKTARTRRTTSKVTGWLVPQLLIIISNWRLRNAVNLNYMEVILTFMLSMYVWHCDY